MADDFKSKLLKKASGVAFDTFEVKAPRGEERAEYRLIQSEDLIVWVEGRLFRLSPGKEPVEVFDETGDNE